MYSLIITLIVIAVIIIVKVTSKKKQNKVLEEISKPFSTEWRAILEKKAIFYRELSKDEKTAFEKRIALFLATKKVKGIETDVDDTVRLMVAASAIIPVFAFPGFNYPRINQVLIYANSFDENFQTERFEDHKQFIIGMVGDGALSGSVILSKPDLLDAFDGVRHKKNVGIHEFVHLLDKQDGVVDGVPEYLLEHSYVGSWLHEIKDEMRQIERNKSDISPYALTNNAEFLAVVSEYFFNHPDKFEKKHPDLYHYLTKIFHQEP
ncbi:MAG: zinc-dependent peptidase [Flavobacteriaceae bacterium]